MRINIVILGALVFLAWSGAVFAAPPGSAYLPGETLDPSCAPGDANCTVSGTAGYFPFWKATASSTLSSTSTLFQSGLNLGINTTAPFSTLQIAGLPPQTSTSSLVLLGSNFITGGNASGTFLGANPTSTFNGDFINFQVGSTTKFLVSGAGVVSSTGLIFTNATGTTLALTGLTIGSIPFVATGSILAQSNANLFWDNENRRLGIGLTAPTAFIDVTPSITGEGTGVLSYTGILATVNDQSTSTGSRSLTGITLSVQGGNNWTASTTGGNLLGVNSSIGVAPSQAVTMDTVAPIYGQSYLQFPANSTITNHYGINVDMDTDNLRVGVNNSSTIGISVLATTGGATSSYLVGISISGAASSPGGNITDVVGLDFSGRSGYTVIGAAATVTNWYGVRIPAVSGPANIWGIYQSGTMNSVIAGKLGLSSIAKPFSPLQISGLPVRTPTSTLLLLGSNFIIAGHGSGTFIGANPTSTFIGDFINFQVGSTTQFRVTGAGRVGIGTARSTTTFSNLHVAGLSPKTSTSSLVLLGSNFITGGSATGTFLGANPTSTYQGDFINFQVGSSTKFKVDGSGRVGIASSGLPFSATTTLVVCALGNCTTSSGSSTDAVAWFASTGGGTTDMSIAARGVITGGLADIGEYIKVVGSEADYSPGDLISISSAEPGKFEKSSVAYDPRLAGVVTETAGLVAGGGEDDRGNLVISLQGRLPVKVTGENGSIAVGDYLTSSDIPGYAKKATAPGRVVAIAMEAFSGTTSSDRGKILSFIEKSYYPGDSVSRLSSAPVGQILQGGSASAGATLNTYTFERLTVGSAEKPSGITIYDVKTRSPYCIIVENGVLKQVSGECGTVLNSTPGSSVPPTEPTEPTENATSSESAPNSTSTPTDSADTNTEELND